jgi:hypothetical protein
VQNRRGAGRAHKIGRPQPIQGARRRDWEGGRAAGSRVSLEREIASHRTQSPQIELHGLEARLRAKLADWRGLLRRNVAEGRTVLRTLLIGPLRFTPLVEGRRRGYAFEGTIALDRLLAGVSDRVASPRGFVTSYHPVFLGTWSSDRVAA